MLSLHKLQEAKKHNGQDEKTLWVWTADQHQPLTGTIMSVQEKVGSRHREHAALEICVICAVGSRLFGIYMRQHTHEP